jgi:hypothetical protein
MTGVSPLGRDQVEIYGRCRPKAVHGAHWRVPEPQWRGYLLLAGIFPALLRIHRR